MFFDDFPYERILSAETIERLEPNKDSVREWRFSEWNVDGQLDYGEFRLYQIYLLERKRYRMLINELKNILDLIHFVPAKKKKSFRRCLMEKILSLFCLQEREKAFAIN